MKFADRRPSLFLLLAAIALALVVSGCSSDSSDYSSGANDSGGWADREAAPDVDPGRAQVDQADDADAVDSSGGRDAQGVADRDSDDGPSSEADRRIVAKGNVSTQSTDVAATVFDVGRIADEHGGEVAERETTTDEDGEVSTARLVLRVPVAEFDETFRALEQVADLTSSSTGKEDVTTEVIDTRVRIRAQRRSLTRVEQLFDRAQSIRDIIRIESEVAQRQADLESLEQRLAFLEDQTSMSTISVNISLPREEERKEETEESGFLAGLEDGWTAMKALADALATLSGRVLPFATVLLLVAGPVLLLVRRSRRRPVAN